MQGSRDTVLIDAIWKYRQCFFKQEHLAKLKIAGCVAGKI